MGEAARKNDVVLNEQGRDPSSIISDDSHNFSFNDVELPLGRHFELFWQDFVLGDLPNEVVERHDQRAKMYRAAYLKTQSKGISTKISDLRVTLIVTFDDQPERWEVEL
jgi:hypothetical protein